ncbi:MAG TPA: adenosine deaminase [Gemmatimonadaceae bacterium]|nr:adenosine deaminase [Gemmatimonadaceae bacterium]
MGGRPPTREQLRVLPKAELHCHLDGSLRPSTLLELAREAGLSLPATDVEGLRDYMIARNARDLEEYLSRFSVTVSVMQSAAALERIAHELVADAAADGVRYIEIRYAPTLNTRGGLTLGDAVEASLRGIERGTREYGTVGRVILCALRNLPPGRSLDLAEVAVAFRHRGVVALDLAGPERGFPARDHAEAFAYARRHDLAITIHAGEGDGADSVRQAVHECGANRLGHATRLEEDPELAQYVNDRRIALEICLTSNVQTRAVPSYQAHPLRRYFDRGMVVALNTDNRLMSGTTLTDEYWHAARYLSFSLAELGSVARNGFAAAFLPWEERRRMLDGLEAQLAALGATR